MKRNIRTTLMTVIATTAVLAMLPLSAAGAQAPVPPPPAAPFDSVGMPVTDEAPTFGLMTPPTGDSFLAGADRLTAMQAWDGGWGWELTAPIEPEHSPLNTLGPIATGLAFANSHATNPAHESALQNAADYLLTKTNNFSPSDGYLAKNLDENLGTGTLYRDFLNTNFYGPLAAGTYNRNGLGTLYDTAGYVALIRTSRAGSQANLAAWDLGMGLVGAIASGVDDPDKAIWVQGVEAEVNELNGDGDYDVIGLAGAVFGLAEAEDVSFDPTSGEHVLANNLQGLGTILAGYQLPSGGWTWNSNYQVPDDDNETIQETAYAILALNRLNRDNFLAEILWGGDYLFAAQLGTGGWQDYAASGENNEVTGEALWGLATAYRGDVVWVCETGDCGHPEMSFNNIQDAVNAAEWGGTVHVLAGTYPESVTISKNVHLIGADMGALSLGSLVGPLSIIQAPSDLPDASQQGSAILIVNGGDDVEITGFTVTGPGPTACGSIRYGIFVRDGAHAKIHDNLIQDIRDDVLPLSGCQNGVGIGVGRQSWGLSGQAEIINNTIVGHQKGGIVVDNTGSFAHIEGNTITGIGTTAIIAQNGIQVSRGATATLTGNTVTGHSFHLDGNGADWGSAGLLIGDFGFGPGTEVSFAGPNTFSDNDVNVYSETTIAQSLGAVTLGGSSAPAGIGMDIWDDGTGTIDATSAAFTGAITCADIEDRVYHKLDDVDLGLVTWTDAVCVTQDSGSIQNGIDASSAGGTVLVFPGNYDETALDRILLGGATSSGTFPYQFGLFFPFDKPGLTVMGVNPDGSAITDVGDPDLPYVTTHSTNNFGPSNFWVEGANVTIQGLRQGPNASGENKSIEVVGDGFTLRYFKSDIPDGGAVYFGDWLYDDDTDTSTILSFHVQDSNFNDGTQIAVSNGTGVSGPTSGRVISNNTFDFSPSINANWPGVSFNGAGGVAWYNYPVGGATISGNSFSGSTLYIRSRGTVEESDFDWAAYWNGNTFDTKVMAGPNPPSTPRAWSYSSFTNVKSIGALIQPEIEHAIAGDTVLVGPGHFPERLTIDEGIHLVGAGATFSSSYVVTGSTIDGTSFSTAGNVIDITALTGDTTIEGFDILTGDNNNGIHFAAGTDAGGSINILDNHITGTYVDAGDQFGVIGGYMDVRPVIITGNEISNTYDNSILMELQLGATEISGNTFNGGFPSVFYMTYDGNDVTPLQKVSGNTFDMSLAEAGSSAAGVGVNPSPFYVTTDRRNGKYHDFEISGNTFTGIADESIKAISVGENSLNGATGGFDNLQILANTISGTNGKGIQFFGHITNATVINNEITGLFQGLKMFSYLSSYWPEGNDISCNQITGASDKLVYWTGASPLVVEFNWWGAVLGPNPALMSANVDYKPWLTSTDCGGGTYPPYPTEATISSISPEPSHRGVSVTIGVTVADTVGGGPVPVGTVDVGYPGLNPIPACNDLPLDGSGMASCSYAFPDGSSYLLTVTFTPTDSGDFVADTGTRYHKVLAPASDFDDDDKTEMARFNTGTGIMSWLDQLGGTWTDVNMGTDVASYVRRSDFDGDGMTDPAKYVDASDSIVYLESSSATWQSVYMGSDTYQLLEGADFDGDGRTDPAKFVPSVGAIWYVASSTGSWTGAFIGMDADQILAPSDYDGDGKTDMAKYVASGAVWYLKSSTGLWDGAYIGTDGTPVGGFDFDGDGKTDMTKYLSSSHVLWYYTSSTSTWVGVYMGPDVFDYIPAADFDGDNETDPTKYVPADHVVWFLQSSDGTWQGQWIGAGTLQVVN